MSTTASAPDPSVAGWDRIAAGALVRTAQAVAAEALDVPFRESRARVTDDGRGALAVDITAPLSIQPLGSGAMPAEPVVARTHRARVAIAERIGTITGRQVARVTVVFDSSAVQTAKRVR